MGLRKQMWALVGAIALAGCSEGERASPPSPETASPVNAPPAAFAMCSACHSMDPGRHGLGPSLNGVGGRAAASLPDYNYSRAMRDSGIIWDRASLDRFLADPRSTVPGSKMTFAGVRDPDRRRALVDYLLDPGVETPAAPQEGERP